MNKKYGTDCQPKGTVPSPPVRPSFADMLTLVKEQVELDTFKGRDQTIAKELCAIIAEVYWIALYSEGTVRIEGEPISYRLVRDIYDHLRAEHLEAVIERYRAVTHTVRNAKAYLRTALYNAVFELELRSENEFRSDLSGLSEADRDP